MVGLKQWNTVLIIRMCERRREEKPTCFMVTLVITYQGWLSELIPI